MNILINLPPAFHAEPRFAPCFERLARIGSVRRSSHNRPEEITADLAWANAVLMWSWPAPDGAMIDAAGGLRWLGQIDTAPATAKACLERKIPLSLCKQGWSPAVAEMALGLILSGLRRISSYHRDMTQGSEAWGGLWPEGVDPRERLLEEVTVGLIGFGGVGRRLRELLRPFGCAVQVVDPYVPEAVCAQAGVQRMELPQLVRACDVVVLCAAANSGSKHVLGQPEIQALKPHAVLVNVARAALVDTQALVKRLQQGDLTACVDVFDQEPLAKDHPLRSAPGALLTPHRAGGVLASGVRILNALIDDLELTLAGKPARWAFTEAMLPSLDG